MGMASLRIFLSPTPPLTPAPRFPVDGRTLVVEFSLSNPEGGVPDLSSPAQHDNVYTKGLPTHWGIRDIVHLFSASGRVVSCRVLAAHAVGLPVAALVQMGSVPEAAHAVATLHNRVLPGGQRPLIVRFAKTSRREAGQAHTPGQVRTRRPASPVSPGSLGHRLTKPPLPPALRPLHGRPPTRRCK